jgi:hypothetical protein
MAKSKSRYYSTYTIKRLYSLSGNRCAFPNCSVIFLSSENDLNLSNICHIEDANQSTHKLDRFNPKMTDKERADYKNLILLCPNHHKLTDDPLVYTVQGLQKMKRDHESKIRNLLDYEKEIIKHTSILSTVINHISDSLIESEFEDNVKSAPGTEEKILFNNLIEFKPIIEEYSVFQGKLNTIYEEIEKQGSVKKEFLLQNIRTFYLSEKTKYGDIDSIRSNADKIFDNIKNRIWELLENSSNHNFELSIEIINIAILIVMVDAFMRCKILEEPI